MTNFVSGPWLCIELFSYVIVNAKKEKKGGGAFMESSTVGLRISQMTPTSQICDSMKTSLFGPTRQQMSRIISFNC